MTSKHQPWYRNAGRAKRTCVECGVSRIGCRSYIRHVDGVIGYVCQQCWIDRGYGAPAAPPNYQRKDECPVMR